MLLLHVNVKKKAYTAIDDTAIPRKAWLCWLGGLAHAVGGFGHRQPATHFERLE